MTANPRKIGKYTIKSVIGEGATSIVYEGFDPDIVRRVAIKMLRANLVGGKVGEELLARFRREAISAARCVHPNVVSILEYGQQDDIPYIVMEYVDGVSVHSLIKHRLKYGRGISLRRSLSIVSQLLAALHAAHKLNIVHRDIKASNVLILKNSGRIKLVDFGMARITEHSDLTMIGSMIGTPRYMAPELRLGLEADSRADVFSAARLFIELLRMLAPDSPFPRSRLPEIVDMPPGNRIDYFATYPTPLIPVLTRALAVDREKRYQTVQQFMRAIKQALPDLKQPVAPNAEQIVPVLREPIDGMPVSVDELDTMESLLADFVGPAATMIMEEHETQSTSAYNLAIEISKEIPEQEGQTEFLKRWGSLSASRQKFINRKRAEIEADKARKRSFPGDVLHKIGVDFSQYVGPLASNLLRHRPLKTGKPEAPPEAADAAQAASEPASLRD
jgi:serine/threonine-protein kinase